MAAKNINRPVIGVFLRHANNVTDYIFKDEAGNLETIQATPEHPFYSIDRHDYIAIGQIWSDSGKYNGREQLKTDNSNNVILVNAKPHNGKVEAVYNFEVYKSHNYLVGNKKFLVHNPTKGCGKVRDMRRPDGTGYIVNPSGIVTNIVMENGQLVNLTYFDLFSERYGPRGLTWAYSFEQDMNEYGFLTPIRSHPLIGAPAEALPYGARFNNKPVYFYLAGHGAGDMDSFTGQVIGPERMMSVQDHADFIMQDPLFKNYGAVCLLTCHAADSGLAQNMANLLNKPVIASHGKVSIMSSENGVSSWVGSDGIEEKTWQTFYPQTNEMFRRLKRIFNN